MFRYVCIVLITLCVGVAGGYLAWLVNIAGGWLLGSLALVWLVAGLRQPLTLPPWLRSVSMGFAGLTVGAAIDAEIASKLVVLPWSIAIMFAFLGILVFITYQMHRRFWGASRATAMACAWPGNILLVFVSAESMKANLSQVAVVQSVRVLVLMGLLPVAVGLYHDTTGFAAVRLSSDLGFGLVLVAICIVVAIRLRLVGGEMFISAFVIGLLCGFDLLQIEIPYPATIFFQIVIGAYVGLELAKCRRQAFVSALLPAIASAVLAALATIVTAFGLALWLDYPAVALLLALAPGGAEAMILLTAEFGLDPGFVGIHHTIRLVALTLGFPLLLRWVLHANHHSTGKR